MKSIEVVGFHRNDIGTKFSKLLRAEGNVPCVLYGSDDHVHFHAPMYLFKDLLYTPKAHLVLLNIEGKEYNAILQDVQFHPTSEMILHVDFLQITAGKKIKIDIPVEILGDAPGVKLGGSLKYKTKKLKVSAFSKDLPDTIQVDISKLGLGASIKVGSLSVDGLDILTNPRTTIIEVAATRGAKGAEVATEEEVAEETAE